MNKQENIVASILMTALQEEKAVLLEKKRVQEREMSILNRQEKRAKNKWIKAEATYRESQEQLEKAEQAEFEAIIDFLQHVDLASMALDEIQDMLEWKQFSDLHEVPLKDWIDYKNLFVALGLDQHPHVVENKINLVGDENMTGLQAKIAVALALGMDPTNAFATNKRRRNKKTKTKRKGGRRTKKRS